MRLFLRYLSLIAPNLGQANVRCSPSWACCRHGQARSWLLPIWYRDAFCGPLSIRSHVYADKACLPQSGCLRPKLGWVQKLARISLDRRLMPSWVARLAAMLTTARWEWKAASWTAWVFLCNPVWLRIQATAVGWVLSPISFLSSTSIADGGGWPIARLRAL